MSLLPRIGAAPGASSPGPLLQRRRGGATMPADLRAPLLGSGAGPEPVEAEAPGAAALADEAEKDAREVFNKPGSVRRRSLRPAPSRPSLWEYRCRHPLASYPAARRATFKRRLLGLAPGGVYPAGAVTGAAVGSYIKAATGPRPPPFHPCLCASRLAARPAIGGVFSVALSVGSPPLAVSQHPALWSPDFPPPALAGRERPRFGLPAHPSLNCEPCNCTGSAALCSSPCRWFAPQAGLIPFPFLWCENPSA